MPMLMLMTCSTGFALAVTDAVSKQRITSDDKIFFVGLSLGLLFSIRLIMHQYQLTRLQDLFRLTIARPRPVATLAQHDWIQPDRNDDAG